jgi:hypothetical protein
MATNFGKDVSCTDSMRTGRYATGVRLVAESYYRRLTTPRGTLRGGEDEANFGLDLNNYVGQTNSRAAKAALPGQIAAELGKDERTLSVDPEIEETIEAGLVTWTITIRALTTVGPFTLQIGVGSVSASLLGIREEA